MNNKMLFSILFLQFLNVGAMEEKTVLNPKPPKKVMSSTKPRIVYTRQQLLALNPKKEKLDNLLNRNGNQSKKSDIKDK